MLVTPWISGYSVVTIGVLLSCLAALGELAGVVPIEVALYLGHGSAFSVLGLLRQRHTSQRVQVLATVTLVIIVICGRVCFELLGVAAVIPQRLVFDTVLLTITACIVYSIVTNLHRLISRNHLHSALVTLLWLVFGTLAPPICFQERLSIKPVSYTDFSSTPWLLATGNERGSFVFGTWTGVTLGFWSAFVMERKDSTNLDMDLILGGNQQATPAALLVAKSARHGSGVTISKIGIEAGAPSYAGDVCDVSAWSCLAPWTDCVAPSWSQAAFNDFGYCSLPSGTKGRVPNCPDHAKFVEWIGDTAVWYDGLTSQLYAIPFSNGTPCRDLMNVQTLDPPADDTLCIFLSPRKTCVVYTTRENSLRAHSFNCLSGCDTVLTTRPALVPGPERLGTWLNESEFLCITRSGSIVVWDVVGRYAMVRSRLLEKVCSFKVEGVHVWWLSYIGQRLLLFRSRI